MAEALSGVRWEDFARARLLEPLGMHRTNLTVDEMCWPSWQAGSSTAPP